MIPKKSACEVTLRAPAVGTADSSSAEVHVTPLNSPQPSIECTLFMEVCLNGPVSWILRLPFHKGQGLDAKTNVTWIALLKMNISTVSRLAENKHRPPRWKWHRIIIILSTRRWDWRQPTRGYRESDRLHPSEPRHRLRWMRQKKEEFYEESGLPD